MSTAPSLRPGQIISGPQFAEAMRVETVRSLGGDSWIPGLVGQRSERFRSVTLKGPEVLTHPTGSEEERLLDAMLLAVPK